MSTETIGAKLRKIREEKNIALRKAASLIDIDTAILSKMERGERPVSKEVVKKLAKLYKYDEKELMILYLSDKILSEVGDEKLAVEAMKIAEEKLYYIANPRPKRSATLRALRKYFLSDDRIDAAFMFGSYARGEEDNKSDLDIMLRFNKKKKISLFDLADIQYLLEQQVKRKVDIVEEGYIKPFASDSANRDMVKIYG